MDRKELLTKAFQNLRKSGYLARQSFGCCASCAGAELAGKVREMAPSKRANVRGAVFYHRQDAASLRQNKPLMIRYGDVEVSGIGSVGIPTIEAGQEIVSALKAEGLDVKWSGDPNECIMVLP